MRRKETRKAYLSIIILLSNIKCLLSLKVSVSWEGHSRTHTHNKLMELSFECYANMSIKHEWFALNIWWKCMLRVEQEQRQMRRNIIGSICFEHSKTIWKRDSISSDWNWLVSYFESHISIHLSFLLRLNSAYISWWWMMTVNILLCVVDKSKLYLVFTWVTGFSPGR